MNKRSSKKPRKLSLGKETLRMLTSELVHADGGHYYPCPTMGTDCPTRQPPCGCGCGDSRISYYGG